MWFVCPDWVFETGEIMNIINYAAAGEDVPAVVIFGKFAVVFWPRLWVGSVNAACNRFGSLYWGTGAKKRWN